MAAEVELSSKIEVYRRMLDRQPDSRVFVSLAEELRRGGLVEQAIGVLEGGLRRHPNYMSARVALARALIDTGQAGRARVELEWVIEAAPDNVFANRTLAEIYEQAGDRERALQRYRSVLALAPSDAAASAGIERLSAARFRPAGPEPSVVPVSMPAQDLEADKQVLLLEPLSARSAEARVQSTEPALTAEPASVGEATLIAGRQEADDRLEPESPTAPLPRVDLSPEIPGALTTAAGGSREPISAAEAGEAGTIDESSAPGAGAAEETSFTTETLADVYMEQGHRERAVEIYRRLLSAEPNNQALRLKLDRALGARPEPRVVLERWLERAKRLQSDRPEAHV